MDNNEIIHSHQVLSDIALATFGQWIDDDNNIYNITDFYDRMKDHISNNIDYTHDKSKVPKEWYNDIKKLCDSLRDYQTFRGAVYHLKGKFNKIDKKNTTINEREEKKGKSSSWFSKKSKKSKKTPEEKLAEEKKDVEEIKKLGKYKVGKIDIIKNNVIFKIILDGLGLRTIDPVFDGQRTFLGKDLTRDKIINGSHRLGDIWADFTDFLKKNEKYSKQINNLNKENFKNLDNVSREEINKLLKIITDGLKDKEWGKASNQLVRRIFKTLKDLVILEHPEIKKEDNESINSIVKELTPYKELAAITNDSTGNQTRKFKHIDEQPIDDGDYGDWWKPFWYGSSGTKMKLEFTPCFYSSGDNGYHFPTFPFKSFDDDLHNFIHKEYEKIIKEANEEDGRDIKGGISYDDQRTNIGDSFFSRRERKSVIYNPLKAVLMSPITLGKNVSKGTANLFKKHGWANKDYRRTAKKKSDEFISLVYEVIDLRYNPKKATIISDVCDDDGNVVKFGKIKNQIMTLAESINTPIEQEDLDKMSQEKLNEKLEEYKKMKELTDALEKLTGMEKLTSLSDFSARIRETESEKVDSQVGGKRRRMFRKVDKDDLKGDIGKINIDIEMKTDDYEKKFIEMIEKYYTSPELEYFKTDFTNTNQILKEIKNYKDNYTKDTSSTQAGGDPSTKYEEQEKTALNDRENQFKAQQEKISKEIQTVKADCEGKQQKADEKAERQYKEERDRQHELDKVREITKINAESYKEAIIEIQEIIEKAKQEILAKKAQCNAVETSKEVDRRQIKDIEIQQQDVKTQQNINEEQMKILSDKIDSLNQQRSNTTTVEENEKITNEINVLLKQKEGVENQQNTLVGMNNNLTRLKTNSESQLSDKDRQMKEMKDMIKEIQSNINNNIKGARNNSNISPVFNFGNIPNQALPYPTIPASAVAQAQQPAQTVTQEQQPAQTVTQEQQPVQTVVSVQRPAATEEAAAVPPSSAPSSVPSSAATAQQPTAAEKAAAEKAARDEQKLKEAKKAGEKKAELDLISDRLDYGGAVKTNDALTSDDPPKINEHAHQIYSDKFFKMFIHIRKCLHGDFLLYVAAIPFVMNNEMDLSDDLKKLILKLKDILFYEFEPTEWETINNQVKSVTAANNLESMQYAWDIIIERDSKFSSTADNKSIMIYSLLWFFHFNTTNAIRKDSGDVYRQMVSNKTIFTSEMGFLTPEIFDTIVKLSSKVEEKIKKIYELYNTDFVVKNIQSIKDQHHKIVRSNKAVIALLKRRDDWTGVASQHPRFHLVSSSNYSHPTTLSYNDTPLIIQEPKAETAITGQSDTYTFHGFDQIFDAKNSNKEIASSIINNYTKNLKDTNKYQDLVFIGYGQSGSGKTSTLIYLDITENDDPKNNGILIQLLHNLQPKTVKLSMIEIYEKNSATEADESCEGILEPFVVNQYTQQLLEKEEKISDQRKQEILNAATKEPRACYKDNDTVVKHREILQNVEELHAGDSIGVMRYIPIGEILDKAYDRKGKGSNNRVNNNTNDADKEIEFRKSINEQSNAISYLYTHSPDGSGEGGIDTNFPMKQYILNGFECREINPTSNNKQSSRSHVVVYLKCSYEDGKEQNIFICDLAGVENVFECTKGSSDIIRMMAKISDNKNFAPKNGGGNDFDKGFFDNREMNMMKYVDKSIEYKITKGRKKNEPWCYPDGTSSSTSDTLAFIKHMKYWLVNTWAKNSAIGENKDEYKNFNNPSDVAKNLWKASSNNIKDKNALKVMVNVSKFQREVIQKLDKYALEIPDDRNKQKLKKAIKECAENIKRFFANKGAKYQNSMKRMTIEEEGKQNKQIVKFNLSSGKTNINSNPKVYGFHSNTSAQAPKGIGQDTYNKMFGNIFTTGGIIEFLSKFKSVNCAAKFEEGTINACKIRRKEGYVINETLANLTKDLKTIAKQKIIKSLNGGPDDVPCIFGDVYDNFQEIMYSKHPLMEWYNIDKPEDNKFGMITTAMCILKDKNKNWNPKETLEFLEPFRYAMVTVLNETYKMKEKDTHNAVTTPGGEYIFINNYPQPPYISVSDIQNHFDRWLFFKFDPRKNDDERDKTDKKESFEKLFKSFIDLIIKLLNYPSYREEVVNMFLKLKINQNIINMDSDKYYEECNSASNCKNIKFFEDEIKKLVNTIEKNNNATFIGTISTTEQVNRVSSKYVNVNSTKADLDISLKKDIMRNIYKIIHAQRDGSGELKNPLISNGKENFNSIVNDITNYLDKTYTKNKLPKQLYIVKELEIGSMVKAIEYAFPRITNHLDIAKIEHLWKFVTGKIRPLENKIKDVSSDIDAVARIGIPPLFAKKVGWTHGDYNFEKRQKNKDKPEYKGYYEGPRPGGYNTNHELLEHLFEKEIDTQEGKDNKQQYLIQFNKLMASMIKSEPSIEHLHDVNSDIWLDMDIKPMGNTTIENISKSKILFEDMSIFPKTGEIWKNIGTYKTKDEDEKSFKQFFGRNGKKHYKNRFSQFATNNKEPKKLFKERLSSQSFYSARSIHYLSGFLGSRWTTHYGKYRKGKNKEVGMYFIPSGVSDKSMKFIQRNWWRTMGFLGGFIDNTSGRWDNNDVKAQLSMIKLVAKDDFTVRLYKEFVEDVIKKTDMGAIKSSSGYLQIGPHNKTMTGVNVQTHLPSSLKGVRNDAPAGVILTSTLKSSTPEKFKNELKLNEMSTWDDWKKTFVDPRSIPNDYSFYTTPSLLYDSDNPQKPISKPLEIFLKPSTHSSEIQGGGKKNIKQKYSRRKNKKVKRKQTRRKK